MALFEPTKEPGGYDVLREGEEVTIRINAEGTSWPPSVEDSASCMAQTITNLAQAGHVTKIIFAEKRDYEYDYGQTIILSEIAHIYNKLTRDKLLSFDNFAGPGCEKCATIRFSDISTTIFSLLKSDPIGCYVELRRLARKARIFMQKDQDENCIKCHKKHIMILEHVMKILEETKLIRLADKSIEGYSLGDRSVYRKIFAPTIKPDFMFAKLMATYPPEGEELASYMLPDDSEVTIFALPDSVQYLYHLTPPEFKLSEEKYDLLDMARRIMSEHKPSKQEFVEPRRLRHVFFNVGKDLVEELANYKKLHLREKEIVQLTNILVRYTIGFGMIEILLQDEKIQDITINSPMGRIPIFVVHADYTDCRTNIIPLSNEAESWASKLRLISGRPLDEANPILDTEIELPRASARVAVISPPLNPTGLAFAFRRHRDQPWTLPLFVKSRMISPMAAGLMSFLIDGSRTFLVAGTRSAGKTSVLGAMLVEIMRKYRMITIEDTLELPSESLRRLGYNIQSMKVASAMTKSTSDITASEGIRTTLRMGDSCLIVGEVRSEEAKALYEAMRVGALANVVAGTIHGDSPYGVFDRVVNDLNIPRTSFKATDIVIVANPIKSADGLHRWRRVTQITEVRKHWSQDPMLEKGFVDLMKYDSKTDSLQPSNDFMNGDSDILKSIAGNVKDWAGNWDAVLDNIMLRAKMKETLVNFSVQHDIPSILEAPFVIQSNDQFHRLSDKVKNEVGSLDSKQIYFEWNEWLIDSVKKLNFR